MAKSPKSKTMAAVHETMTDLHAAGAIDAERMRQFDAMCLAPEEEDAGLVFTILRTATGDFTWHLTTASGERIAVSAEAYRSKSKCLRAIALVRKATAAKVAA